MNLSEWFQSQLQASAEGFVWSLAQVPQQRRYIRPPALLGEWSAARHAFHLLFYEQTIALPSMRQWLDSPLPSAVGLDEDAAWAAHMDLDTISAQFSEIRAEQIAWLPRFDESLWNERRVTVWGAVSLRWVVTKTYQHTAEHIHDVLTLALFWDMVVEHQRA
jgi:hypothetical protein